MKYTKKYKELSDQLNKLEAASEKIQNQIEEEAKKFSLICGADGPVGYKGRGGCGGTRPLGALELVKVWKWNRGDDDWDIVAYEYKCPRCQGINRLSGNFFKSEILKHVFNHENLFAKITDRYE